MLRFLSCVVAVGLFACGSSTTTPPSLVIAPGELTLAAGDTGSLSATFVNNDTTTAITWTSSDTTIATVTSSTNGQATVTGVAAGVANITATGGGASATLTIAVNPAELRSIGVTPPTAMLPAAMQLQLIATGVYSDQTTRDLTASVSCDWTSSSTANATVGATGLVTAATTGSVTITATVGAISGSATITVTAATLASIAVTPTNPSVAIGLTKQLTATGTFSDHTTLNLTSMVTWSSGTPATATVSAAGLVSALVAGTTTVTAALGTISGSTTVTVTSASISSIAVTPTNPTIGTATTQQFTAMATLSDTTTQDVTATATWASSAPAVATIAAGGLATALSAGPTTISATVGTVSGSTTLTVTGATLTEIQVTPTNPSVALGLTQQFTATAIFSDTTTQDLTGSVVWASDTPAVAQVSNAAGTKGLATSLATGSATISATLGSMSGSTTLTVTDAALVSIDVTPANPSIPLLQTQQMTATGTFTDGSHPDITTTVTWTSTDPLVASISNAVGTQGQVTGLLAGTATMTATSGAISGSTTVTITNATLVSIAVTPADPSIAAGTTQQFTATGTFSDGTTDDLTTSATWASSDATVATISNAVGSQGLATAVGGGTITITATDGLVSGSTSLTVAAAVTLVSIAVTPTPVHVLPGGAVQTLTATGTFSDSSTQDVTSMAAWTSSDPTIATVTTAAPSGQVTGVKVGSVTITAAIGAVSGTATAVVDGPAVTTITPLDGLVGVRATTSISIGFNQAMDATSLTGITATGACSGSVQLSADGFATCVGFASASPTVVGNTFTFTPAAALATLTTYQVRVLGTATNAASAGGVQIGSDTTQATGFTIETDGTCAAGLVISQLYGAGGNSGATFNADFVELHNAGASTASLAGLSLQYGSATGSTWNIVKLPTAASIPPGGYFLVQLAGGSNGVALPVTADFTSTAINMGAAAGKIALVDGTIALGTTCPAMLAGSIDFVGYGTTANCFEGAAPTPAPSTTASVARGAAGCTDANANSTDFTALTPPAPRNSATDADVCACAAAAGSVAEVDYCDLQFPATLTLAAGDSGTVFGQVYEAGFTEAAGANPAISMQVGLGAAGADPTMTAFTWIPTTYNVQAGNNDEYQADLTAPATSGTYSYTTRASRDGVNWTYCDLDGNGSNIGLTFDPTMLGVLTVQ